MTRGDGTGRAAFVLTQDIEEALTKFLRMLSRPSVLGYLNEEGEFIVDSDATNHSLGGVLSQLQYGQETFIPNYSQALTKSESHYYATWKQLLAVVQGVQHFHPYMHGKKFTVWMDHAALQWLLNFKTPKRTACLVDRISPDI